MVKLKQAFSAHCGLRREITVQRHLDKKQQQQQQHCATVFPVVKRARTTLLWPEYQEDNQSLRADVSEKANITGGDQAIHQAECEDLLTGKMDLSFFLFFFGRQNKKLRVCRLTGAVGKAEFNLFWYLVLYFCQIYSRNRRKLLSLLHTKKKIKKSSISSPLSHYLFNRKKIYQSNQSIHIFSRTIYNSSYFCSVTYDLQTTFV